MPDITEDQYNNNKKEFAVMIFYDKDSNSDSIISYKFFNIKDMSYRKVFKKVKFSKANCMKKEMFSDDYLLIIKKDEHHYKSVGDNYHIFLTNDLFSEKMEDIRRDIRLYRESLPKRCGKVQ